MELQEGQTAVVTGAASGMGRAFAERFGALGMNVVLADVEEARLVEVAGSMREDGANVLPVVADVASGESVDELARKSFDAFGAVHVLCNNAGVGTGGPIAELGTTDWQWTLGVNLWGVIHGIRAFLPTMLTSGEPGHIVNTASLAGLFSAPMMGPYNASKYAVVAISEALRSELAMTGANVSVSVLCPGFVNTDIMNSSRNRPNELAGYTPASATDPEMAEMVRQRFEAAMRPDQVAEIVERGIREDELYLFTEGAEFVDILQARFDAIIERLRLADG